MRYQRKTILKLNHGRLERQNIANPPPHIDSDWCCVTIIEFNEDGHLLMIHKRSHMELKHHYPKNKQ